MPDLNEIYRKTAIVRVIVYVAIIAVILVYNPFRRGRSQPDPNQSLPPVRHRPQGLFARSVIETLDFLADEELANKLRRYRPEMDRAAEVEWAADIYRSITVSLLRRVQSAAVPAEDDPAVVDTAICFYLSNLFPQVDLPELTRQDYQLNPGKVLRVYQDHLEEFAAASERDWSVFSTNPMELEVLIADLRQRADFLSAPPVTASPTGVPPPAATVPAATPPALPEPPAPPEPPGAPPAPTAAR